MLLKYGRDLRTIAAANVSQYADTSKVIGVENCGGFTSVNADHCRIKYTSLVGMSAQVIENRLAENLVKCSLAGLNAISDFAPRAKLLVAGHQRQSSLRSCNVAAKRLGQRRHREMMCLPFGENPDTRQGPQ